MSDDPPTVEETLANTNEMLRAISFYVAAEITREVFADKDPDTRSVRVLMLYKVLSASLGRKEADNALFELLSANKAVAKESLEVLQKWKIHKN